MIPQRKHRREQLHRVMHHPGHILAPIIHVTRRRVRRIMISSGERIRMFYRTLNRSQQQTLVNRRTNVMRHQPIHETRVVRLQMLRDMSSPNLQNIIELVGKAVRVYVNPILALVRRTIRHLLAVIVLLCLRLLAIRHLNRKMRARMFVISRRLYRLATSMYLHLILRNDVVKLKIGISPRLLHRIIASTSRIRLADIWRMKIIIPRAGRQRILLITDDIWRLRIRITLVT